MTATLERTIGENPRVRKLVNYVSQYGFKSEGVGYFRSTWMDQTALQNLENSGMVSKVGIVSKVKELGIKIPENPRYNHRSVRTALIFKVNGDRINSLIE